MRKLLLALLTIGAVSGAVQGTYCIKADGTGGCSTTLTAAWAQFKSDMSSDHGSYVMLAPVTFLYQDSAEYAFAYFTGVTSSAANTITVRPDTGAAPIIEGFYVYVPYVSFLGMKVNGADAVGYDASASHGVVANCDIYNSTGQAIFAAGSNFWAHDNYIHDVTTANGGGISILATGGLVEYNEVVGAAFPIGSLDDTVVRHNIVCCESRTEGMSTGFVAGALSDNVAWGLYHCIQPNNGTAATGVICVNNEWGQHYESGAGGVVTHGLVTGCLNLGGNHCDDYYAAYASANPFWTYASIGVMPYAAQGVPQVILAHDIGRWAESDFNDFFAPPGSNALIAQIQSPVALYEGSLAAWQSDSGLDAHSVSVNPRFVAITDPPALALGSIGRFTCTGCTTVAQKLRALHRAYMPTNLLLKGKGCAWNGSACVPDHSDIGPVPVTVYDAPGITGGGVY